MRTYWKLRRISSESGFTLGEIMLVMGLVTIMAIIVLSGLSRQIMKSNDTKRKNDLVKLRRVFEEFYNDKECYPDKTKVTTCRSGDLKPYIDTVPCDTHPVRPYLYVPNESNQCSGYVLCTKLQNVSDPDITRIGCDPVAGCGWAEGYNYCISSGTKVVADDFNPSLPQPPAPTIPGPTGGGQPTLMPTATGAPPTGVLPTNTPAGPTNTTTPTNTPSPTVTPGGPTPTPTPLPGVYGCDVMGVCQSYLPPRDASCPFTYQDRNCYYGGIDQCQFIENRCTQ